MNSIWTIRVFLNLGVVSLVSFLVMISNFCPLCLIKGKIADLNNKDGVLLDIPTNSTEVKTISVTHLA